MFFAKDRESRKWEGQRRKGKKREKKRTAPLPQQPLQTRHQPCRDIPLEPLLQLEKLAERRIVFQRRQFLCGRSSRPIVVAHDGHGAPSVVVVARAGAGFRETDLRQQTLELSEAFADLDPVRGGEVVEGEGEEGFHFWRIGVRGWGGWCADIDRGCLERGRGEGVKD